MKKRLCLFFTLQIITPVLFSCNALDVETRSQTPIMGDMTEITLSPLSATKTLTPAPAPLNTNTPTATGVQSPVKTSTLAPTQTPAFPFPSGTIGLFGNSYENGIYSFFPFGGKFLGSGYFIEGLLIPEDNQAGNFQGPNRALYLRFANYADLLAFWTPGNPSRLLISDLTSGDPQLIFEDSANVYPEVFSTYLHESINLQWIQNDKLLVVIVPDSPELNFIYNLDQGLLEPWPYSCDQVIKSSMTGNLALACNPLLQKTNTAVIEWGGEVWYTTEAPGELVTQKAMTKEPTTWAWSADGNKFAYFDTEGGIGELKISDRAGNVLIALPELLAYWTAAQSGLDLDFVTPLSPPIFWSADGSRIVVYARSQNTDLCPDFYYTFEEQWYDSVPCWMVIDADTGEIVWSITTTLDQMVSENIPAEEINPWSFFGPAISPDGQFLVLNGWVTHRELFIIDVDQGVVNLVYDFILDELRWGIVP